jgi:hypothetical protein
MTPTDARAEIDARLSLLAWVENAIRTHPDHTETDIVELAIQDDACRNLWPELGRCIGSIAREMYQVTVNHLH